MVIISRSYFAVLRDFVKQGFKYYSNLAWVRSYSTNRIYYLKIIVWLRGRLKVWILLKKFLLLGLKSEMLLGLGRFYLAEAPLLLKIAQ